MNIKTLYIQNFGKFENYQLDLDDGFNIIFGKNEDGKSTIMDFILMMFYGHNGKKQAIQENPRKKYQPWNGKPMKGKIIFEDDGIEYGLERTFKKTNKTDIVKLYDNLTGEEIKTSGDPGEYFFDLGEDAFERTVFVSSRNTNFSSSTNNNEITQKLMNLVTTGNEETSHTETLNRLVKAKESILSKNGKKGYLAENENRIEQLNSLMNEALMDEKKKKEYKNRLDEFSDKLNYLDKEASDIQKKLKKYEDIQEYQTIDSLLEKITGIEKTNQRIENAKEKLTTPNGVIDNKFISECNNYIENLTLLNSKIEDIKKEIDATTKKINIEEKNLKEYKDISSDLISNLRKDENKLKKLEKEINEINEILENQKNNNKIFENINSLEVEVKEIKGELSNREPEFKKLKENKLSLDQKKQDKQQEISELKKQYSDKEKESIIQQNNLENIKNNKQNNLEKNIANTQDNINAYKQLVAKEAPNDGITIVLIILSIVSIILFAVSFVIHNNTLRLVGIVGLVIFVTLLVFSKLKKSKNLNNYEQNKAKLNELEKQLNLYKEEYQNSNLYDSKENVKAIKNLISEIKDTLSKYNNRINILENEIKEIDFNLEAISKNYDDLNQELNALNRNLEVNQKILNNEKEKTNELVLLDENEINEQNQSLKNHKKEKKDLNTKLNESLKYYDCKDIFELSNYYNNYVKINKDILENNKKLKELEEKIKNSNNDYAMYKNKLDKNLGNFKKVEKLDSAKSLVVDLSNKLEELNSLRVKSETETENYKKDIKGKSKAELKDRLIVLKEKLNDIELKNIDSTIVNKKIEKINNLLKENKADADYIKGEIIRIETQAKTEFKNKENVSQIEAKLFIEEKNKMELEDYFNSLNEAINTLDEAFDEIQRDFSPQINQLTSDNFNFITNGKYDNVKVDNEYNINVLDKESGSLKEWGFLSAGTIDQAYISLRLAVASILSKKSNPFPLFFDDVFVQFDDERTNQGLDCILGLTSKDKEKVQVILFSCHERLPIWGKNKTDVSISRI